MIQKAKYMDHLSTLAAAAAAAQGHQNYKNGYKWIRRQDLSCMSLWSIVRSDVGDTLSILYLYVENN